MQPEKVRLLFVDDEADLLAGLRLTLRKERDRWSVRFAGGGEEALALLAEEPADVVVSDMRMPGMDGAELLQRVRAAHPETIRIVLSGQADERLAMRAVPVAHQWLSKPCDRDRLVLTIDRAVETSRILTSDRVRRIVGGLASLPAPPRTFQDLMALLMDPEASSERVSELVEQNPALAARVLQMANSAFFGLMRKVASVRDALGMLGFDTLSQLVLTAEVIEAVRTDGQVAGCWYEHFRDDGLLVARVAARILQGDARASAASSAGLLHDLGQLVLARHARREFESAWELARATGRSLEETEREAIGATHSEVGAALLGVWGLPSDVIEAVAHHHVPSRIDVRELDPLLAVHVAQALSHEAWALVEPDRTVGPAGNGQLDRALLARLGLLGKLAGWRKIAAEEARFLSEARRAEAA